MMGDQLRARTIFRGLHDGLSAVLSILLIILIMVYLFATAGIELFAELDPVSMRGSVSFSVKNTPLLNLNFENIVEISNQA